MRAQTLTPSLPSDALAGDLLRAEQVRPNSEVGAMIKDYIKEGKIVPMEVTVKVSRPATTCHQLRGEEERAS